MRVSQPLFRALAPALVVLANASCSTPLSAAGQKVAYATKAEPAPECKLVSSVEHDEAFDCEPTVSSLQNVLRNKTGELGGNYLVLDVIVARDGCFQGTGRAFLCPQAGPSGQVANRP